MNAITETLATPLAAAATRPFYWSLRRELWEHRSLYIAPLVAAAVIVIGFVFNAMHLPQGMQILASLDVERQRTAVSGIYGGIAVLIVLTMAVVAWVYSLDALHGERRDRSVLFWKSLPISDTSAVLSKLSVAMLLAPAIAFVIVLITQLLILLLSTAILLIGGVSPAPLWMNLQLFQLTLALLYTLVVLSLWYAPIYAWLLLISAWAKRSTFLWAVLPPVAISMFEELALDTNHFSTMLEYRFSHGLASAFNFAHGAQGRDIVLDGDGLNGSVDFDASFPDGVLQVLNPLQFLANPYLWVGLAVAAGFVAAAVWMRRYREPI